MHVEIGENNSIVLKDVSDEDLAYIWGLAGGNCYRRTLDAIHHTGLRALAEKTRHDNKAMDTGMVLFRGIDEEVERRGIAKGELLPTNERVKWMRIDEHAEEHLQEIREIQTLFGENPRVATPR